MRLSHFSLANILAFLTLGTQALFVRSPRDEHRQRLLVQRSDRLPIPIHGPPGIPPDNSPGNSPDSSPDSGFGTPKLPETVSFFHINDMHAHIDEWVGGAEVDCKDTHRKDGQCVGGSARLKSAVHRLRSENKQSLFLVAGDETTGTLFYSYHGHPILAEALNDVGVDGFTLGNHEFDEGTKGLAKFLPLLNCPVLAANIESENEVVNNTVVPYHIYWEQGVAVIGAVTETTKTESRPGKETKFHDVVSTIQKTVDEILLTTNITRIVALTHIGYEEDKELARSTTGLSLIIGGHTDTPLGPMVGRDDEPPEGEYPTIEKNLDGEKVYIVTDFHWSEWLGHIDMTWDESGRVVKVVGKPVHLVQSLPQEPKLKAKIHEWREAFAPWAAEVIGHADVELESSNCKKEPCLFGELLSDAMLSYSRNCTNEAHFAIMNGGGCRADLPVGDITRYDLYTSFPFKNIVVDVKLTGSEVWRLINGFTTGINHWSGEPIGTTPQLSRNIRVMYETVRKGNGEFRELRSVEIGGEPLDLGANYTIATTDFIGGTSQGDNYLPPRKNPQDRELPKNITEILEDYIRGLSPVKINLERRMADIHGDPKPSHASQHDESVFLSLLIAGFAVLVTLC